MQEGVKLRHAALEHPRGGRVDLEFNADSGVEDVMSPNNSGKLANMIRAWGAMERQRGAPGRVAFT